jgi:cell division protein FtsN
VASAPAAPAAPTQGANVYFVQAGAFTSPTDAEQQRARLAMQGFNAKVYERASGEGKTVFRVRIGPFDEKAGADALLAQVQGAGLEAAVVAAKR